MWFVNENIHLQLIWKNSKVLKKQYKRENLKNLGNAIECNWILVDINLNKIYQEVFSIKTMHFLKKKYF